MSNGSIVTHLNGAASRRTKPQEQIRPEVSHDTDVSYAGANQDLELFSDAEQDHFRGLVPALGAGITVHVNAGLQPMMNTRVKDALDLYLTQATSVPNPKPAWQAQASETKTALAAHLNIPDSAVVFTRDTTEGLNLFQRSLKYSKGDNILVLEGEHPNHAYGWLALVADGLEVRRVPTPEFANADTFAPYVNDRTICIGVSSVMFHSGQMNDIKDICNRFRPRGIHVLADITQHIGAGAINLTDWNVSAAAFSTHKGLLCPTGLGGLYIHPEVLPLLKPTPPIVGAGAIANLPGNLIANPDVHFHSTTQRYAHLNTPFMLVAALGASLQLLGEEIGMKRLESHLRALGRELIARLDALDVGVVGAREVSQRSPHICVVRLTHPDWASHFVQNNVWVSHYRLGVRVSFGFYSGISDVEAFIESVKRGLEKRIPKE